MAYLGLGSTVGSRRRDCEKRRVRTYRTRGPILAVGGGVGDRGRKAKLWEGESSAGRKNEGPDVVREECSWKKVEELIDGLGEQISAEEIDVVLGITRGGMVPATLVCEKFQLRNLMSATVLFYTDTGAKFYGLAHPRFLHFPEDMLIEGRRVLIVDDVWDTGNTARSVRERVRRAGGDPVVAVLHFKPLRNQFEGDAPDFYGETTDSWIHYPWEPTLCE